MWHNDEKKLEKFNNIISKPRFYFPFAQELKLLINKNFLS
jgi:hypothetical protein